MYIYMYIYIFHVARGPLHTKTKLRNSFYDYQKSVIRLEKPVSCLAYSERISLVQKHCDIGPNDTCWTVCQSQNISVILEMPRVSSLPATESAFFFHGYSLIIIEN